MNILVLGNGFDLAHKLPTAYEDFLNFTDAFIEYKNNNKMEMNLYWFVSIFFREPLYSSYAPTVRL